MKTLLKENDFKEIEKLISRIEKQTSGEIVVTVAHHSLNPWLVELLGGFSLACFVTAVTIGFSLNQQWLISAQSLFIYQLLAFLTGSLLMRCGFIRKNILPRSLVRQAVYRESLFQFSHLGLHHTREHTGVLVFISQFERTVQIIGDSGINDKVTPSLWNECAHGITKSIQDKNPVAGILKAVENIGKILIEHFPPRPDDTNELSNEVVRL